MLKSKEQLHRQDDSPDREQTQRQLSFREGEALPSSLEWGNCRVQLYFAATNEYSIKQLKEFESLLNPEELDYIRARKDQTSRRTALVSRGLLRWLLAPRAGIDATELIFEKGKYGKPYLSGTVDRGPYFSLSHCHECILIAVSNELEVGVDLERINPALVTEQLIEDLTSAEEQLSLASLHGMKRIERFFELWVEKESLLKASGTGLSGLSGILSKDFDRQSWLAPGKSWQTVMLPAPAGYVAAISFADGQTNASAIISGGRIPCNYT